MKETILILHGWGLNSATYKKLVQLLIEKKFIVYCIDMPGFGKEKLQSHNMNLDGYVEFVHSFMKKKKLSNVLIIGHSFGGRVGIKYAWKYPEGISKLVLTGVPIIRHNSFLKQIAYFLSKKTGRILSIFPVPVQNLLRKVIYHVIGEWDYYKAGELKQTFKNIINEDIFKYLKKLKLPIILIWGEEDTITPSSDVKIIKDKMPSVQSTIVPNTNHRLPYFYPDIFVKTIENYL